MKRCGGCEKHCELGYTITSINHHIAPSVGGVAYWVYDIYSSGVRRRLFQNYVGSDAEKAHLKLLMLRYAKDIARYCEKQK